MAIPSYNPLPPPPEPLERIEALSVFNHGSEHNFNPATQIFVYSAIFR